MQLGIIIYSNDAETVWNAFRLAVFALRKGESVRVFLLAKDVEAEKLDTEKFKVTEQMQSFADAGGEVLHGHRRDRWRWPRVTKLCDCGRPGVPAPHMVDLTTLKSKLPRFTDDFPP